MKIRKGFVSNSSSSSFVVALDKPIIDYSLSEFMNEYNITDMTKATLLYRDLLHCNTDIEKLINDETLEDVVNLDIDVSYNILSYDEREELKKEVIEKIKQRLTDKFKIVDGNCSVYILEYSDNDGKVYSDMEHNFMPYFKGTVKIVSHH